MHALQIHTERKQEIHFFFEWNFRSWRVVLLPGTLFLLSSFLAANVCHHQQYYLLWIMKKATEDMLSNVLFSGFFFLMNTICIAVDSLSWHFDSLKLILYHVNMRFYLKLLWSKTTEQTDKMMYINIIHTCLLLHLNLALSLLIQNTTKHFLQYFTAEACEVFR